MTYAVTNSQKDISHEKVNERDGNGNPVDFYAGRV